MSESQTRCYKHITRLVERKPEAIAFGIFLLDNLSVRADNGARLLVTPLKEAMNDSDVPDSYPLLAGGEANHIHSPLR